MNIQLNVLSQGGPTMFGSDFFKVIQFITALLRLIAQVFGNEEDKKNDTEQFNHNSATVEKIIADAGRKTTAVTT